MGVARVLIRLRKTSGSAKTSPVALYLIDPASGETVATLDAVSGFPGDYYAADVPEGNWTLAIDGVPSDHPAFQSFPVRSIDSLGHSHSSGQEMTVEEAAYDTTEETAVGQLWQYKLTCRSGYSSGTLKVYLNGLLLPNSDYFSDSVPRMSEGSAGVDRSKGLFYIVLPARLAGISPVSQYYNLRVEYEKTETG